MKSRDEIATIVRDAIAEVLAVDTSEIEESSSLDLDFRIDSLELMEIGTVLETKLDVRVVIEDLVTIRTVGEVIDLLVRALPVQAGSEPQGRPE